MSLYVPNLVSPGLAGPPALGSRRVKKAAERDAGAKIHRFGRVTTAAVDQRARRAKKAAELAAGVKIGRYYRPRDIVAPPFVERRMARTRRHPVYGDMGGSGYLVPFASPGLAARWEDMGGLFKSLKKVVRKVVSVPTKIVKKTVQTVGKNWKTIAIAGAVGAGLYFGGPALIGAIKSFGAKKLAATAGKMAIKQIVKRVTGTAPPPGVQAVPIASMQDGSTLYEWNEASTIQVPAPQESSSWWQQARAVAVDAGKAYIAAKAAPALPGSIEATQADYATGMIQYGGDQAAGYGATAPYSTAAPDPYASAAAEADAEARSPILAGFGGMMPLVIGGLLLTMVVKGGRRR